MKTIGILGSGIVAKTLGAGFLKYGYEVMMGTSSPEKLTEWLQASGASAKVGSFEEAAAFGQMIVLAVKGEAAENALMLAGASNLKGKTVIDTCNPIDHRRAPVNGVLPYFTSMDESLMERLQRMVPDANFVKCFSMVGNAYMVDPQFADGKPTMFICGNELTAKQDVGTVLDQFGWEYEDMGMVEAARAIEPLCILWCIPGFLQNRWNHAFKLIKAS